MTVTGSGSAPVSVALACAALLLLFLQDQGPLVGLYQRLLSGTIALWSTLVALRLPPNRPRAARPRRSGRHDRP